MARSRVFRGEAASGAVIFYLLLFPAKDNNALL